MACTTQWPCLCSSDKVTYAVRVMSPVQSDDDINGTKLSLPVQFDKVDDFTEISRDRLEFVFNTNIIAMFRLAQLARPHMGKGGAIINVASVQAYSPTPGILDYACTKVRGLPVMPLVRPARSIGEDCSEHNRGHWCGSLEAAFALLPCSVLPSSSPSSALKAARSSWTTCLARPPCKQLSRQPVLECP